jgi:hypothetical protein
MYFNCEQKTEFDLSQNFNLKLFESYMKKSSTQDLCICEHIYGHRPLRNPYPTSPSQS